MPLNLFFGVEDFRTIIHHQFDGKTGEQFDDIRLQCQWHITRSNLLDAVCLQRVGQTEAATNNYRLIATV